MRLSVVRSGNSRGVRIPKALLDRCAIGDAVDLTVEDGGLVRRPVRRARAGWVEAAATMAARGEDRLIDPETPTAFDVAEWEW